MPLLPGDPQLSQNQGPAQLAWQNRPTRMPQFMGTGNVTPPPPAADPTPGAGGSPFDNGSSPNDNPTYNVPAPARPRTRLGSMGGDDPYLWANTPNPADQNESTAARLQSGAGYGNRHGAMRTRMAGARQQFAPTGFGGSGGGGLDPNRQGGPATSDVPKMNPAQYAASRVYTPPSDYVPPAAGAFGSTDVSPMQPSTFPPAQYDNGANGGQKYDDGAKGYPAPQFARGGRTGRGC